eukprot:Skav203692  [mRNA]  locus=scaffold259:232838:246733:+ [translate_table: standard]
MAFRLTYRRQCRYNTKSNKQRVVKTPGGRAVLTKKAKGPHCGDCGKALIGLPRLRPFEYMTDGVLLRETLFEPDLDRYCTTGKPHRWTPAERCVFSQQPALPYYWDESCKLNNQERIPSQAAGCWADGVHSQCRFCGQGPFTGCCVKCPRNAIVPDTRLCAFDNEPKTPYYWEPRCRMGIKGCFADGQHVGCRFCGANGYEDIPCPASACNFENEPWNPYYWDDFCQWGSLGCNADGHHIQCRFCDKVNAQCRFCGSGPYEDIPCPEDPSHPEEPTDPDEHDDDEDEDEDEDEEEEDPEEDDAVSPGTPGPTDPEEGDAVSPDTPGPTDPEEDDAVSPDTPGPTDPEEDDAVSPETPGPTDPEEDDAVSPDTPGPTDPEEDDAVSPDTPGPTDPEEDDTVSPDPPGPRDPEDHDSDDEDVFP